MSDLYGVGKTLQFIKDHFYFSRIASFICACVFASFGFTFSFFFFIFFELFLYFCQYMGPIVDSHRKDKFEKWVDDSIKATGGESANCLNSFLQSSWQPLFPDTFSPFFSGIIERFFNSVFPGFIRNIKVRSFFFGKKPPKIIQVITEDQSLPSSMSIVASAVFAQDMSLIVDFTIFRIPFTVEVKDVVFYAPLRITIETPENQNYLYLAPISAIAFSATEDVVWLSNTLLLNGFNIGTLPLINFLWCYMLEYFLRIVLSNGETVVWDFVTGNWSLRHVTRPYSSFSEALFKGISDRVGNEVLGRFSMPEADLLAFNETRKMLWDRLYAAKIPPNKRFVQMGPGHGQDSQPLLPFELPPTENVDEATQVTEADLPPPQLQNCNFNKNR